MKKSDVMGGWGLRAGLVLAGLLLAGQAMAQGVRWEDYRGDQNAASDANYNGPAGAPKFTNYPNSVAIANLRTVSASAANAVRTGTSATIDFASGATDALCDNRNNTTSVPCRLQAQGKVAYALVRFPQAGTYIISAAHDDNVVIELSPDFTNTNYRTASYSILAGQVSDWSSSETDFQAFGTFTAANANSCALLRMYWNNQSGLNYNHLQWTPPGGSAQIIPASALFDPAAVSSSVGCNGSITGNLAGVTLNKVIGSPRISTSDQFTILIDQNQNGSTNLATATTTGTGTGQQASTSYATTTSTTYYLREVMAAGSNSALTAYTAAIACTRNGTAFTPNQVGNANNRRWSISSGSSGTDQVVCTITNTNTTVKPTVTVNKVSVGGTGTFAFSGSNGIGSRNITTSGDSVPTAGPADTLTTASTSTTVTEGAPPAGWTLQGISCTGLGSGTATPNIATRTVTLDANATANGNAITCTFTNRKLTADLSITKTNGVTSVISGGTTTYTIRVTNNTGADTATGAILSDPSVTGLTKTAVACSGSPGQCTAGTTPSIVQLQAGYALPALAAGQFYEIKVTCTVN